MGTGCNSGRWVACCLSEILYSMRPVGQAVKTRPFHGCNMGSIPVRVIKIIPPAQAGGLFLCFRTRNRTGRRTAVRNEQSSGLFVSPREIPVRVTKTSYSQGSRMFFFISMWFGPTYGNRTARARRPAYRRAKTLLRSVFRAREILRTGHRSLLLQLRLEEIFLLPYEELLRRRPPPAADAGSRSRAAGRRGQAPPHGALTDAGYPRPVQGGAPQCATNSPVDCSLARGRFPYGSTEEALFLHVVWADVRELLRRRPPPAADAGSRSRAAGRRGQAPPQGALTDAGYPRPVQGGAPQCATNSPVDCSLARGRFPYHQGKYLPALFYPLQFVLLGNQPFEFFFQFLFILAVGGGQP